MDSVELPFKIIVPHSKCDTDYHGFVWLERGWRGLDPVVCRSESGRAHPKAWREWLQVICNNPDCKGVAILNIWALFDATRPAGEGE